MKLETINLLKVETKEGFVDIIDLEEVKVVNRLIDYGVITLKNGLVKCLDLVSTMEVERCLNSSVTKRA